MTNPELPSEADLDRDTPLLPGMENDPALGAELLVPVETQRTLYSGKIVDKNEARVSGILAARAIGVSLRKIMQAYRVSAVTVAEIERRHAVKLATLKDRLARQFGVFLELGLQRAIEKVDRMDVDKLMVSLGIAADKLQVLTGEPSVIVGNADGPKQFTIDSLRERLARRPVIDVTPTGLDGGEREQTRAGLPAPAEERGTTGENKGASNDASENQP